MTFGCLMHFISDNFNNPDMHLFFFSILSLSLLQPHSVRGLTEVCSSKGAVCDGCVWGDYIFPGSYLISLLCAK